MIVLSRIGEAFPDDVDPSVRYRLPVGLRPIDGDAGVPQVSVTRSEDGGVLHLRLGVMWPALAEGEKPAPLSDGRFRLRVHGPSGEETGEWRAATVTGAAAVDRSVSLSPTEVAIARHLGERTGDIVDVDVELTIRGRGPSAPWLVSIPWTTLQPRLAALLGSAPVAWERVEAVVLGLPEDTFTWYPLTPGALRLPRDAALRAIAALIAPEVFARGAAGWKLRDDAPAKIDVRLDTPRHEATMVGLRWSFTEFLAAQSEPQRHLIDVIIPEPFAAADISVFNDLPLAADGIRSIAVEFRTGGPTGRVRHEFLPGQPSVARLRFVRETMQDLKLEWSAKATIVTGQGPAIHTVESRPSGLLLDLNAETLGITPVRCVAHLDVFAHVSAIEVALGTRTLTLTRATPEAWAIGRRPPETASVTAVLPDATRVALGPFALMRNGLEITSAVLGVGDIAAVTVHCPDAARAQIAYLAFQAEGHGWHTLDPSQSVTIPVRRDSRFTPPRLRYRTRHVARDGSGKTSVMAESAWRDHLGDTISVSV